MTKIKNSEAMRKNVFILAAAALLFAGCAKEVAEKFEAASFNTTIGAVIDGVDTKAALADAGAFTWQEGDKIAVYTSKGVFKEFTLTDGAGKNKGQFSGTLAEGETVSEVAVYPSVFAPEYVSASEIKVTLPDTYTYDGENTRVPMIAQLDKSNVLAFKQNGGVIKFSITGIPEGAAKLVVKSDLGITGTFKTAPFKTGQNVPIVAEDETSTVTINFTRTGDAMNFYVPVPVGVMHALGYSLQKADGTVIAEKITSQENIVGIGTLLLMPVVATVTEGNISTVEQLEAFLASSTSDTKGSFRLVADIDCAGVTLSQAAGFGGSFDGQGHFIKNLVADKALFATNDGIIKNLLIDETCSFSKTVTEATDIRLAPIVVRNNGTIKKVFNMANVTVNGFGSNTKFNIIAGIAAESYGPVTECVNSGDITYNAGEKACYAVPVAGIVAILGAEISACENYGKISLTAPYEANLTNYTTATPAIPLSFYKNPCASAAGIVTYALSDNTHKAAVKNCCNYGKILYSMTTIEKGTKSLNRIGIAGVVANTGGDVTGCKNIGEVNVIFTTSTRAGYNAQNAMIHAAGIAGNDYYSVDSGHGSYADNTVISNCVNEGDILVDFDSYKSNSAIGGVSGWPGVEDAQKYNKIDGCINYGNVVVSGVGKSRTGGVAGGATNLYNCINYGYVTNNISSANNNGGTVGGVLGYWTYGYALENCESYGDVFNNDNGNVYAGGLVGAAGAQPGKFGIACVVDCRVHSSVNRGATGMVVGRLNDVGQTDPTGYVEQYIGGKEKGEDLIIKGGSLVIAGTETVIDNENVDLLWVGEQTAAKAMSDPEYLAKKIWSGRFIDGGVQFSECLSSGYIMYDNKKYPVVKLADDKWWMAAPLAYVPAGKPVSDNPAEDAGIWFAEGFDASGNPIANTNEDGLLYDFSTAFGTEVTTENFTSFEGVQGICPPGWYIPTRADFLALIGYSTKASGESGAIDDSSAKYYVTGYQGSNVTAFNKAGWNFSFLGVRTKIKTSTGSSNVGYNKNCTGLTNYADARYMGKPALNNIMTSTPYQTNAAGNIQFFGVMSSFTDKYPEGRLNLSYVGFLYGMEVRCVRKAE